MPPNEYDDMTPDEIEAMKQLEAEPTGEAAAEIAAAAARAEAEELGENTVAEQAAALAAETAAAEVAAKAEPEAKPAAEAEPPSAEALAEIAAEEPAKEAKPFVPQLKGEAVADYDKLKKELRTGLREARAKHESGELSDEAFAAIEDETDDKLEALMTAHTTAVALQKAHEQIQAQALADAQAEEDAALRPIIESALALGIDYREKKFADQFDRSMDFVGEHPKWANKSFAERSAEAHRLVLDMHGKTASAPAPAPAPAPAAAAPTAAPTPPKGPRHDVQLLGDLPAAAAAPVQNEALAALTAINDPDQQEAMLERMSKSQREALMRAAVH